MKLHSGRRADSRDLVALGAEADFDRVEKHLHRGDPEKLAQRIDTVLDRLTEAGFEDAFKGVFQQTEAPEDDIDAVVRFLEAQQRQG